MFVILFSWFLNIPVFYSARLVFLQKNRSHEHTSSSSSSVRLKMTNSNREVWGYILWVVYFPVSLVSHPLWFQWGGKKYLFTICKHHTSSIHAPISPVPHSLSNMHHPATLHLLSHSQSSRASLKQAHSPIVQPPTTCFLQPHPTPNLISSPGLSGSRQSSWLCRQLSALSGEAPQATV